MRIALVLGSGGARGFAHVGAVRALTERGHEVAAVAGTSVGALVGGMTAAGQLEEFASWITGLGQRDILRLMDPSFTGAGMIRAERVLAKISDLLGDVVIEDLPVPYTAVATDLRARREVWFQRGPLDAAIRASIAIPTIITPVVLGDRILVDGGLLNPVPVGAVLGVDVDGTFAVSLNGERAGHTGGIPERASAPRDAGPEWIDRFRKSAFSGRWGSLLRGDGERGDAARSDAARSDADREDPARSSLDRGATDGTDRDDADRGGLDHGGLDRGAVARSSADVDRSDMDTGVPGVRVPATRQSGARPPTLHTTDVLMMSLEAVEALTTRHRLAAMPPDVLVTVPASAAGILEFHRSRELIDLGHRLASDALDQAGW